MQARWKKNKNLRPRVILEKIDRIKILHSNGNVSYSPFEYEEAIAALQSMVEFPRLDEGLGKEAIVSTAVNNAAKRGALTDQVVINEVNSEIRSALSKREDTYYLLTSLSLGEPYPASSISSGDCQIKLSELEFPRKFLSRYEALRGWERANNSAPPGYARVIIRTKAKSQESAVHKALRELDIQRAIWAILCNSSMEISLGGTSPKPINKIRLGAAHTIHDKQGRSPTDQFWYDPNFVITTPFVHKNPPVFTKNTRRINRSLNTLPYRFDVKDALLRFVRALDEVDHNVALIRLWGALERLAAPSEQNYDRVTKRASFIFADRSYHEQVLEHLREYRNRNVHASEGDERAKIACFQLQRYFIQLVLFHLKNSGSFESLDEANSFLDLPSEIDTLKTRERHIKKAIRFVLPGA